MSNQIITIGTSVLGVAYRTGNSIFSTPNTLLCSYADPTQEITNDSHIDTLNWQGMPISITQFYDPTIDDTGDIVGSYFAMDVIKNTDSGFISEDLNETGVAKHATWNGNKIQISLINNRYYLNVINIGGVAEPYNRIILNGTPQATGLSDEIILNDSGFTMGDIDDDPNTVNLDLKSISLGGVPITIGRVGYKYYLIVKEVLEP